MRHSHHTKRTLLTAMRVGLLLSIVLTAPAARVAGFELADTLASLEKEFKASVEEREAATNSGASSSEAFERWHKRLADLARRALTLVEAHPEAPDAPNALVWIVDISNRTNVGNDGVLDAAYDLMAERYLDRDAILRACLFAGEDTYNTAHAEKFLRAAIERSPNFNVRALACLNLARNQHELARAARGLGDSITEPILERNLGRLGREICQKIRAHNPEVYRREAEALYERTRKEFADLRPLGNDFPPLGEQAEGALYRLRNLEVGCTLPEVVGEDIEGKPLKLSEFRGKVVVITFWATWCGPCMGLVPAEKELVERMNGRPFVLLGVNSDKDRAKAKEVSAQEGISWRSFWDGGPSGPIAREWGVTRWPTIYVVDAEGKIRDDGIIYFEYFHKKALDKAFEPLVAEAEARNP